MSHLALYRKYRPTDFAQVRGQESAVDYLQSVVKSGHVPHAIILTGSRGIGKTTLARIFAKSLNIAPQDIYEIDAASYRKVETMRELVQNEIPVLPTGSPLKMYILDEVHMLTTDSFNTLLKTLEEPPNHVIFVLATTELSKVLPTVVSRCQVIQLRRPTVQILTEQVIDIAHQEGKSIDKPAAEKIAQTAGGSFRDALVLLDRVLEQSSGKTISLDDVGHIGLRGTQHLADAFLAAYAQKDSAAMIQLVTDAAGSDNKGINEFMDQVIHLMRLSLYSRYAQPLWDRAQAELSDDQIETLAGLSRDNIITPDILAKFLAAYESARKSAIPTIPIELAIIEILGNTAKQ